MPAVRVPGLALLLLTACTRPPPPSLTHAAVAFRDDVPGYQKVASQKYALHNLDGTYDSVVYLEANPADDGQVRWQEAVRAAAAGFDTVDLFFLSNGGRYELWARPLEAPVRAKLRFVYDTGAGDARQGSGWMALGARAFVGHPAGNVAPLFLGYFLPRWVKGVELRKAMDEANKETKSDLTGTLAKGVVGVLDSVGGPHLDTPKLWAGTEAELYGDPTLVVR